MRLLVATAALVFLTACGSTPSTEKTRDAAEGKVGGEGGSKKQELPVRLGKNAHYQRNSGKDRVVVFVHGVYGSALTTWKCDTKPTSWPELMAADEVFKNSDIYVVDYPSPKLGNMMSVDEEVSNIMNRAKDDQVFEHKEIVFLVHSLGGLVTQRLLLTHREVAAKTKFIYFFSTPVEGAQMARIGHLFNDDPLLKQMYQGEGNSTLEGIERDWTNSNFAIPRYCAYERQPTKGVLVVGRLSGTRMCTKDPVAIYANHNSIVEACDISDDSYIAFRSAYRENPVTTTVVEQREWRSPQNVDCNRTNANPGMVASVALNPAFHEVVINVTVRLEGPDNIKDAHITLVTQSGNTATINYGFNGLDKQFGNCPGGGHATVVAAFTVRGERPIE